MIHQINSDFPNFRPVNLTSGVNIILAEKKINSTNSVGKSLVLESINYILGADYNRHIYSNYDELEGYSINVKIDLDGQIKEYSRVISSKKNIYNKELETNEDLDDWKKILLSYYFSLDSNSSILSWRNLLHFFYQDKTLINFDIALKSNSSDADYKMSLYQSFFLDIAKNEIDAISNTVQIKSEKRTFNRYLNTLKKSLKVIPELVPNIDNLAETNNKLIKEMTLLKIEISQIEKKINVLNSKNDQLSATLDDIVNEKPIDSFVDFQSFFRIVEAELGEYIKKTFQEAQTFHRKLIVENIEVIKSELKKNKEAIRNLESSLKLKHDEFTKRFSIHNNHNEKIEEYNLDNIILNNLVQNGGQVITSIIDKNIKEITKTTNNEIPEIIINESDKIDKYRRFLTTLVNLVYKSDKNVKFEISYNEKIIVNFKYNDDTGTGKGNMKIIIYYIFILLLNNVYLKRNIDFLILDTDITDGIDSDNLLDLLKITDRLFKKHNLQLILTLRKDRMLNWDYVEKKDWIKYRLNDSNDGYLFKSNLK